MNGAHGLQAPVGERFVSARRQVGVSAERTLSGQRQHGVPNGIMQRSLQTLFSYWNQVRAGRLAPHRLEIEPSRIAGILAETFMLERIDARTYQFRLAGTRLCELFGSELRGKNFLEGWSEQDCLVLERHLTTISEQGAAGHLTIEGVVDSRHRIELDANLLPLVHTGNKITRIIGAMSATSAPHWLGSEPLRSRQLKHHQIIWPDGRPHAIAVRLGRQAPFQPPPAGAGVPPVKTDQRRFRVLEGGRTDGKYDKR
jgi:hypothetical protein